MTWQPTDDWPDERAKGGGAFRGAAEVVVARREPPTAIDTLRLWWHSSPDYPFGAVARRVALTPGWLYAETRSGGRRRAPLEAVRGSRREAGRVIYAVADGDDLVLVDRGGDALERALDEAVGVTGEWRDRVPGTIGCTVFVALPVLVASAGLVWKYGDDALSKIGRGLWTSETAAGLYAGLAGVLLMLLLVTFFPPRHVADSVGLTIVRGVFGWVRTTIAVERITSVSVRTKVQRYRRGTTDLHSVHVIFENPAGEEQVHFGSAHGGSEDSRQKREQALQIARRLAKLYGVRVLEPGAHTRS